MQAIVDGLVDQRMIGNLDLAGQVLGAGHLIGEHGREQILGAHALDGRGNFSAAAESQNGERARSIPAPARGKHRRIEHGLGQDVLDGLRLQELENQLERKGVLLGERYLDAVVGGGSLQLEIEGTAEALAQRQSPGAVDARAEGRMNDQLHPAAFVEEAFGDDALLRGQSTEQGGAGPNVNDRLFGAGFVETALLGQEGNGLLGIAVRSLREPQRRLAKARRFGRELRHSRTEPKAARREHLRHARGRARPV